MHRRNLLVLFAAVLPFLGLGVWFTSNLAANIPPRAQADSGGFVCPLTGEKLPCSNCCPLNQQTAKNASDEPCCCDDPTCSPGCCPDCPPDCCSTAKTKPSPEE
jgi:hypothetical protein